MASIEKRGDKYTVRWRDAAGRGRRRTCPNLTTARALKREVEEDLALGAADWRPRTEAQAPDLSVIFQAYLEDRARLLAPATLKQRHMALQLFLAYLRTELPIGHLSPSLLTRAHLTGFHRYMREVRKNTELSAIQRVRMIYYAWVWAFDSDEFELLVSRPKRLELPVAQPELQPSTVTWTVCDAVIAQRKDWYRSLLIALRFTGLRKNQVMRLKWADVDLERGLLVVRPELGKSAQERRGRVVPLSPHFIALLKEWPQETPWLVQTDGAGRSVDYHVLQRIWRDIGVKQRQPSHAFRKAFVSGLIERGVQEHVVQALVGHARTVTTQVYTNDA